MAITKDNWQHSRRKEWHGWFIEMHLASWNLGISTFLTGHNRLYCIEVLAFTLGYEYRDKALRRALRR